MADSGQRKRQRKERGQTNYTSGDSTSFGVYNEVRMVIMTRKEHFNQNMDFSDSALPHKRYFSIIEGI